jgi:hypothetical protein
MSIKGYPSQEKLIGLLSGFTQAQSETKNEFCTVQKVAHDKNGLDVINRGAYVAAASKVVLVNSTKRVVLSTAHGARVGDYLRFTSGNNIGLELGVLSVPDANTAILTGNCLAAPAALDTFDVMRYSVIKTDSTGATSVTITITSLDVVDQIDTTPLLSIALTNITASSGAPVAIVASLAAAVKKVKVVEDIGEFIGLYTGAGGAEVLKCVLPLGGGDVDVTIAAGTRISLRAMKNTAITSDTFIAINFLG